MDKSSFMEGRALDAYEYFGAHAGENSTMFRVYAPGARAVGIVARLGGDKKKKEYKLDKTDDAGVFEKGLPAAPGTRYMIRVHTEKGKSLDHADPYAFQAELRPKRESIVYDGSNFEFTDTEWMGSRSDAKDKPVNIYEVHAGSWKHVGKKEPGWPTYNELADMLIPYMKEWGYNYLELMPLCEYPCDESWGYQATGFFAATARYGSPDGLKYLVNSCHRAGIGVILDIAPVHFAVDDFGLARFAGEPLYEYPYSDIEYNEWGSKNFCHERGEVRSFLQSSVCYWIEQFHIDGIRMDAISNMIYWQGNPDHGENKPALEFLRNMNSSIKQKHPDVMLIAEDSTAFSGVTRPVCEGGLGFDYKWDMGWMNDTLAYFMENPADRPRDYHKLTFSMFYYYSERFLMPFSHDEVVHMKDTIQGKMYGEYENKFAQAKALFMYMYSHPGKQLNFMGNELAQFREWDEKREQDWLLLDFPKHVAFHEFMKELNHLYLDHRAFYELDYDPYGFLWTDCTGNTPAVYSYIRRCQGETILAIFNFSGKARRQYRLELSGFNRARLMLDSDEERWGGEVKKRARLKKRSGATMQFSLEPYQGLFYVLEQ